MQYKVSSLADLPKVAGQFMTDFSEHRLFALIGEMGAGKTTLVKAICDYLGVEDAVSSPTFSIVNEYTTAQNDTLFHFDFYRLNDEQEALDFGVEEYFDSGEFCFMEWTEKIPSLLPEESVEVKIEEIDGGVRLITVG
ncbi:MAG: tRNA (adenosine(37)-N6)-threonylcarbamoyltransferase complex ATPase subunit type 1 TsaE [Bacteroidia bacterium]|nr:MAG: tRNA (adenosine(37)-N6)-threonylcarbamoyltransferase complex ATPase subunit type 1 TsaE [Bacteroidia bacterium]